MELAGETSRDLSSTTLSAPPSAVQFRCR